jgi:hypothetical protein
MAASARASRSLAEARTRVLARLDGEIARRLASRWVRWTDTFALPVPDTAVDLADLLASPWRPADDPRRQDYRDTVLPIFDAALGIIGAPRTERGEVDYQVLTGPWRQACLPTRCTPATAFGPHTQAALSVLRFPAGMPTATLRRMVDARRGIAEDTWQAARVEVDTAMTEAGYPYRARCLYWEAVAAAEAAAGRSPTDRELVDALWGAAVTQLLPGRLPAATTGLLCGPFRASGMVVPG